eukprot:1160268-Pelagomonas_calceolata.AAC.1
MTAPVPANKTNCSSSTNVCSATHLAQKASLVSCKRGRMRKVCRKTLIGRARNDRSCTRDEQESARRGNQTGGHETKQIRGPSTPGPCAAKGRKNFHLPSSSFRCFPPALSPCLKA